MYMQHITLSGLYRTVISGLEKRCALFSAFYGNKIYRILHTILSSSLLLFKPQVMPSGQLGKNTCARC